jgi:Cu(I)/Ag(I) efflux system membrane fusion protein
MLAGLCLIFMVSILFSCHSKGNKTSSENEAMKTYTCPMHPQIMQDKPGKCPICGMNLVKKEMGAETKESANIQTALHPVNQNVLASIKTIKPLFREIPVTVEADGYLDYDTRTFDNISARYNGRIERLYVKFAYQEVKKGDRLYDIYSADILTAQQNLLYLLHSDPMAMDLISNAEQNLALMGLTMRQVKEIEKTGKAKTTITVYSPYSGHVHETINMTGSGSPNMNLALNNTELSLKEGTYVAKGQVLFSIVNPNKVWAILKVSSSDIQNIKLHQAVDISFPDQPGVTMQAKVDFVEPIYQSGAITTTVRVYLDNNGHKLNIGTLVKASIDCGSLNGLWVPATAVIDLGHEKIVWLKKNNEFTAHGIEGMKGGQNQFLIKSGLTVEDEIAIEAQYLVDSESFIKTKPDEK